MRVLLVGWFSFVHGEATAGDVQALQVVRERMVAIGVDHDVAWSPVFRPGALSLEDAEPSDYTHVVFVCGPISGPQVEWLHTRFSHCARIAVGVSVVAPGSPATTGFDTVLARDRDPHGARWDLSLAPSDTHFTAPVVAVVLTGAQEEYGDRARHTHVTKRVTQWIATRDCAPVPLSTRLDSHDWRHCATPDQFTALLRRFDLVVSTRLHGMVFALRAGVPAIAVDPVLDGAKISAQARALDWPALITPERSNDSGRHPNTAPLETELTRLWDWCLSPHGRHAAARYEYSNGPARDAAGGGVVLLDELARTLGA